MARSGIEMSLSNAAVSGLDLAALDKLNVRYVGIAAGSVGSEPKQSAGIANFVQAARALRVQVIVTGVANAQQATQLMRVATLRSRAGFRRAAPRPPRCGWSTAAARRRGRCRVRPAFRSRAPSGKTPPCAIFPTSIPCGSATSGGVLHDGHAPFPPTVDCLQRHRRAGGAVILVSNSPRSTIGVSKQLDELGVPRDAYDTAVTSGDVTRDLIQQTDGKLFHLGPARDLSIFDGLHVSRVLLPEASAVICTGLFHDDRETPADYAELLADIRRRGLPMICANPDKVVRKGGRLQYCAGALAEAFAAIGGEVRMAGKPYAPIYDLARRRAAAIRDHEVPLSSILAIGDGPEPTSRERRNRA